MLLGKGTRPKKPKAYEWGERTREVEQGPEGALYVLEDGDGGRLLKLTPSRYKALRRNKGSTFDCKMLPTRPPACSLVF